MCELLCVCVVVCRACIFIMCQQSEESLYRYTLKFFDEHSAIAASLDTWLQRTLVTASGDSTDLFARADWVPALRLAGTAKVSHNVCVSVVRLSAVLRLLQLVVGLSVSAIRYCICSV